MRPSRSASPYERTRLTDHRSFGDTQTGYDPKINTSTPERSTARLNVPRKHPHADGFLSKSRIVLRILSFCFSASIVGVVAHTFGTFEWVRKEVIKENSEQGIRWLGHLKSTPSIVLLSVSSVATFLSLILLFSYFMSKPVRHVTVIGNLSTAVVGAINLGMWTAVKSYFEYNRSRDHIHRDLTSYVCAQRRDPRYEGNRNTKAICREYTYAWIAVYACGLLELLVMITVIWGTFVARKSAVYTKI